MDLHHLHTVNYDRKPNNERATAKTNKVNSKDHHFSNKTHKNKSNQEEKIIRSLHDSNQRQEYNQTNQRCRHTGAKLTSTNSKSKVHQNRVKDIVEKIPSIRTLSLEDVGKRLKKSSSTKLKPKPKTRGKNRRSKQNRIRFQEKKESQDDIKVLYTSERVAGRNSKKQNTKKKLITLHTRTSSADLFSTPSISKFRSNLYLYYQTCKESGLLSSPTRRKKKPVSKKPNIIQATYPLMIQSYKRAMSSTKCFAPKPYHDTLVDSSRHRKFDNTTQRSQSQFVADLPKCVVSKDGGGEMRVVCSQPVFAEPAWVNKENNAIRRFFKILKKSVMFVLLCLTVIAWSPCIIIMFIFWYIMSLLLPDAEETKEVIPCCPKRKNFFFSRLIHRVPRLYNRIMCTFKSVKKSFQFDDEPARPPKLQSEKKYELYYTANKGWLMTEASKESQSKPCRNEKSVKFWDSQNGDNKPDDPLDQSVKCEPPRLKDTSCSAHTSQWPECKNPSSKHESPSTSKSAPCFRRASKQIHPPGPYRANLLSGPHQRLKLICWKPPRRQPVPISRLYKQPYHCRNIKDKDAKPCPAKYAVVVPRVCNLNQEELAKICSQKKKKCTCRNLFKKCCHDTKRMVKETDATWESGVECTGNMYLHTLRNKPCFWMYNCCPSSYPTVLTGCRMCQGCFKMLMYALASCVWCPLFCCAYCCYLLCCTCLDC